MLHAKQPNYNLEAIRRDLLNEGFTETQVEKFFQVVQSHSDEPPQKPSPPRKEQPLTEREKLDLQWEKNEEFFLKHEKEFEEKYPGLYVAVHDGEVLDTDKELGSLANRLYEKLGNIPMYADIPGQEEEAIVLDLPITF